MLKEGESYYLTNAQVKPIHNPTYNKTSHKYELSLNQNTVINECHIAMNKPKLKLNLVKLIDIQEKGDKESVDVIGVCKHVKDLFEGTSR